MVRDTAPGRARNDDVAVQVMTAQAEIRPGALTVARRNRFLDTLAETCNVSMAAAAVGASKVAFYALRRRDPLFAEQWVAALTIGYETLEASLIDYAMGREADAVANQVGEDDRDRAQHMVSQPGAGLHPDAEGVPARVQVGLLLLARHRATLDGGKPIATGRRVVTAAETDAVLNKRLDQLARSIRIKSSGAKSAGGQG